MNLEVIVGAWGVGTFENDYAADWVAELQEAVTIEPVVTALQDATAAGYLEARACSVALAAAEAVAAARGKPATALRAEITAWAQAHRLQVSDDLMQLAHSAVCRIDKESELLELWQDSDELEAWLASIKDLESRLRVEQQGTRR